MYTVTWTKADIDRVVSLEWYLAALEIALSLKDHYSVVTIHRANGTISDQWRDGVLYSYDARAVQA